MSDRPIDINLSSSTEPRITEKDRVAPSRAEIKARLAQVLDRGIVNDRLHVDLPADVHGEWVPNTKEEIYRMQTLGFDVDREYAKKRAIHNDGTDVAVIGDVIFMTCPKVVKEVIDEVRREKFEALHGVKNGKQKEERDFENTAMRTLQEAHMRLNHEVKSSVAPANKEQIEAALDAGKT